MRACKASETYGRNNNDGEEMETEDSYLIIVEKNERCLKRKCERESGVKKYKIQIEMEEENSSRLRVGFRGKNVTKG